MWKTVSEQFEATVRTTSREHGINVFTKMAAEFFECDPEVLLVRCFRSYVEDEARTANGDVIRMVYGMDFGAVMREEVEE
jgi:hypothetical protein